MENVGNGDELINRFSYKNYRIPAILDGLREGKGWDVKPAFYFVVVLDDYEFQGRKTYSTWDTGYMNNQMFRVVENEQLTTDVSLTIFEKVSQKQLLKTTTQNVEKDTFHVTFDFKTGRWSGDDSFNDTDGYGHYDGENFEIWFSLYNTAEDEDNIPYWVEVNELGTDPYKDDGLLDPDGDNISTEWEWKWGYDPFIHDDHDILDPDNDGIQNEEEYFMEDWLANPYYPEIYIEADYMETTPKKPFYKISKSKNSGWDGWKHTFYKESQQLLIERFNEHGITMHIDDGTHGAMSQGGDIVPFARGNKQYNQDTGVVSEFYHNNFEDERKGIFRYTIIAYGGGWCHPQDENQWYDCIVVPHNWVFFKNQLSFALTDRTIRIGQAVQMLHELGHSLGMLMEHSSGVDNSTNRNGNPPDYPWWDYYSCMNYDYFGVRLFDYSDGTNGEYDTDDWSALDLTFFQRSSDVEIEGLGAYDEMSLLDMLTLYPQ